jgi:hypothetical protein
MGVYAFAMAEMPPLRAPAIKHNKCSYSAPSDSDSETEDDDFQEHDNSHNGAANYLGIKTNAFNGHKTRLSTQLSKQSENPAVLLHMISDERDLWTAANQEMKRQTWVSQSPKCAI